MAKIMLVEDDNNLREIYEARLMAEGYEIVTARDGEEALAVAVKERPDLIISDVMMPKISGFDMLDILRSTPETKNAKVIMMTALSQAEDKERASKLGADRYLVKSQVTLEDVAKVAHEVLEGTPAGPATDASAVETPSAAPAAVATPAPAPEETAAAAAPVAAPVASVPAPEPEPATTQAPAPEPVTEPEEPATPVVATPVTELAMPTASTTIPVTVADEPASEPAAVSAGITDLSSPTTPVDDPTASNDIVKSTAEVWSADALDNPAPEVKTDSPTPEASTTTSPDVSKAEAAVDAATTQSLEDEEAAIAKQIESIIDTAPVAAEATSTEAPADLPAGEPVVDAPAPASTPTPIKVVTEESTPEPAAEPAVEAPAEPTTEAPAEEAAPAKSTGGQKVIQPINDLSKPTGPDLNELAKREEALENQHTPTAVITPNGSSDSTPAPTKPEGDIDPNSLAL